MSEAFVAGFLGGLVSSGLVIFASAILIKRKIKEKLEGTPFGGMM